ncbi:MAG: hypothetical protein FWC28_05780 [Proteobacteria bacterium]|nr:hypothetical protein [Cystobacterineae bacterium]MCL2258898.1 hypothetical protein [Cystobacterineae bacterium]MCL2314741.1 hypothetical protein [Pseudomonadota bacterium]
MQDSFVGGSSSGNAQTNAATTQSAQGTASGTDNVLSQILDFFKQLFGGQAGQTAQGTQATGETQTTQEVQTTQPQTFDEKYDAAVTQFHKNFSAISSGGDAFSFNDLKNFLQNNPGVDPELKAACQLFINNPAAFDKLCNADANNSGLVSKSDMDTAFKTVTNKQGAGATQSTQTQWSASKTFDQKCDDAIVLLYNNKDMLPNWTKRDDLKNLLNNNPDMDPNLREACKFLIDNPGAFDKIDSGNWKGEIGSAELGTAYEDVMKRRGVLA